MFPWPSPAKTTLSRNGTTCLLGYSQTLIDHHFVMAARFFETLKKNGLGSSAMTAARAVPLSVVNAFVLPCDVPVPPLSALPLKGKRCSFAQSAFPAPHFLLDGIPRMPASSRQALLHIRRSESLPLEFALRLTHRKQP